MLHCKSLTLLRQHECLRQTSHTRTKVDMISSVGELPCYPLEHNKFEPRREKTGLRGFRPGLTQTELYSHRSMLEA